MGHLNRRIPAQVTLYRIVILAHSMSVSVKIFAEQGRPSKSEPMLKLEAIFIYRDGEIAADIHIMLAANRPHFPRSQPSRYQEPEIEEMVKAAWGTCGSICPKRLFRLFMSQRSRGDLFTHDGAPHQLRPCRSPARGRDRRRASARPRDTARAQSHGCAPRACRRPSPPQRPARAGR